MHFKTAFAAAMLAASTLAKEDRTIIKDDIVMNQAPEEDTVAEKDIDNDWIKAVTDSRQAYCRLKYNPAYPTTYPYGNMELAEYWGSPLFIRGWMRQLPAPSSAHGFAFNERPYDGHDCRSTWTHFNPTHEPHGSFNGSPSHVGQLEPIVDDDAGYATYGWISANRPTIFWGTKSVVGRSMVVYEMPDDFGASHTSTGSMGREIACCNLQLFAVLEDWEGP